MVAVSSSITPKKRLVRRLAPPEDLQAALFALEITPCTCPLFLSPVCLMFGGCELQRCEKRCDCARWPGSPCEHVIGQAARFRAATAILTLQKHGMARIEPLEMWSWFLWALYREEYEDRPLASRGSRALTRQARLWLYEARAQNKLSLFHKDDIFALTEANGDNEDEQQTRSYLDQAREQKKAKNALGFLGILAAGKEEISNAGRG